MTANITDPTQPHLLLFNISDSLSQPEISIYILLNTINGFKSLVMAIAAPSLAI